MKTIRFNTFETNSSSTHAIGITKENNYKLPSEIEFSFGEFGWEYAVYRDNFSKCQYLITAIYCCTDKTEEYLSKLKSILHKHHIKYTIPDAKWQKYEHDGIKRRYAEIDGYIDHGNELNGFLDDVLYDSDKLFRFLFNDESYVSTGSDNDTGYYIPEIGSQENYYDEDYNLTTWYEKIEKLKEKEDIYLKGN